MICANSKEWCVCKGVQPTQTLGTTSLCYALHLVYLASSNRYRTLKRGCYWEGWKIPTYPRLLTQSSTWSGAEAPLQKFPAWTTKFILERRPSELGLLLQNSLAISSTLRWIEKCILWLPKIWNWGKAHIPYTWKVWGPPLNIKRNSLYCSKEAIRSWSSYSKVPLQSGDLPSKGS